MMTGYRRIRTRKGTADTVHGGWIAHCGTCGTFGAPFDDSERGARQWLREHTCGDAIASDVRHAQARRGGEV